MGEQLHKQGLVGGKGTVSRNSRGSLFAVRCSLPGKVRIANGEWRTANFCLLIAVLLLVVSGCRQHATGGLEDAPPPLPRPDLLTLNRAPEHSPYVLQWGPIRIPLYKVANPNVYGGEAEVELNEFWTALDSRLELMRENERQELELVSLNREPWSWRRRLWFSYPSLQKGLFEPEVIERLRQELQRGEQLNLRLRSLADSAELHPVIIRIRDPFAPYSPEVAVDRRSDDGAAFGFQMIQLPGRPPILRIDTSNERTRHIYEMYRNEPSYRILHVPGFTTRRRYITEADELFPPKSIHKTVLLCQPYDLLTLPEYVAIDRDGARLSWGNLDAAPSGPLYALEDIRQNQDQELAVCADGLRLPVRNFHLYISSRQQRPALYIGNDLQAADIQVALARLQPESTVYFDRLVVEDAAGRPFHLRGAFAFSVGSAPEYDLHIAESRPGTAARQSDISGKRKQGFDLQGQPLADAVAFLLHVPVEQLLLEHFSDAPRLDLSFVSPRLSVAEGRDLALAQLQEQYHFTIERLDDKRLYRLEVSDPARLDSLAVALFPEEKGPRQFSFSSMAGRRTVQFQGARMAELIRFLRNEFRISIVDATDRLNNRYDWQLPVQSLEDTRGYLPTLGLSLQPVDRNIAYVLSQW